MLEKFRLFVESPKDKVFTAYAPAPVMRESPEVPAELEKKYAHRQVVVSGVVDKEGRVSRLAIKESPDARVSSAIVQALSGVFRPAALNNHPVAVKLLLGIPLQ